MPRTPLVRFLEILPGSVMWLTFLFPITFAFFWPKAVSIIVMLYALFWFFRTLVMSTHLILGYRHYKAAIAKKWLPELKQAHPQTWQRVHHLVFVPMYKEELPIIRATFKAIAASDYPLENIIPVLCTEGRAGATAQETATAIKKEFGQTFKALYHTTHPDGIVGEVKGKGPNMNWAAKEVVPQLLADGYAPEDILVTSLDSDNRVDPQYFACVAKAFLDAPDPKHTSFQPLSMYFNNIWDVPLFIRMIALGSSFWVMIEATRPDRLRNFSAHAQSLSGLMATDYWSSTSIVEDGHQYWRSLYCFNGKHTVVPIFVPIYQDAVLSHSLWDTIKEQYIQKRRWAWGVSDVPYVFVHNLKNTSMSFFEKWKLFFRLFEGHYSWATTSLILAFGGWPPLLINANYQQTVFAYNFPIIYSRILFVAGIGMIVTLVISTLILPPVPARYKHPKLILLRDWIFAPFILPITNITLGALPAIDAQTRLMFGKYLEWKVTVKKVIENHVSPVSTNK